MFQQHRSGTSVTKKVSSYLRRLHVRGFDHPHLNCQVYTVNSNSAVALALDSTAPARIPRIPAKFRSGSSFALFKN